MMDVNERGNRTAFFYGTLMAPQVLYRVIYGDSNAPEPEHGFPLVQPALLKGYRRHRVSGAHYPAIRPCAGAAVRGSLVSGLTDKHIRNLDMFEGDMYQRHWVPVQVLKDVDLNEKADADGEAEVAGEVPAETYVWREGMEDHLEEQEWDFEEFRREKMRYWTGDWTPGSGSDDNPGIEVDEGFADVDRANEEERGRDPTGGRGANGAITRQLDSEGAW